MSPREYGTVEEALVPPLGSAKKKSGGRAWQLFIEEGLAKTTTTTTPAPAAETTAPGGGDGSRPGGEGGTGNDAAATTTETGGGGCRDERDRDRRHARGRGGHGRDRRRGETSMIMCFATFLSAASSIRPTSLRRVDSTKDRRRKLDAPRSKR